MGSRNVKFKFSIKEISFEFEGDEDIAQVAQRGIERLVDGLTNTQNQILGVESETSVGLPTTPSVIDGKAKTSTSSSSKGTRKRGPKGDGAGSWIFSLAEGGFFSQYRSIAEIQAELTNRGKNFESKNLASALKQLTEKKVLVRKKNDSGNFVYRKSGEDES